MSPKVEDVEMIKEAVKPVVWTGEDFIHSLGNVLTCWVQKTAAVTGSPHKMGRFHSARVPPLTITDYLKRIHKHFFCSDECFVMALVLIDRASKTHPSMTVCDLTVHRLLITAVMIAAKFHDDLYYSNGYYAKVGGLGVKEANLLESNFLKLLDWKVHVTKQEYELYHRLVCQATGRA